MLHEILQGRNEYDENTERRKGGRDRHRGTAARRRPGEAPHHGDMGITKGVQIYVRKVAPLGDPMELTVRNYELSVRKADAEMIEVV